MSHLGFRCVVHDRQRTKKEMPLMADKPNILVIWGDDIGWWNVSAYNHGSMGYRTPNIDRIGREGAMFTDWYGQQSCTAGRAAFITGQSPIRTGLTKVGLPGAKEGFTDARPDDRRSAQAARLRHRSIRQEPSRRPQRAPTHGPRLRRVLRKPLSPERRGRAGAPGLSQPRAFPQFPWIASGHVVSSTPGRQRRTTTPKTPSTGVSASRRSKTPDR